MNAAIALLLAQDGLANGIVYALLAIAILLVFLVTRILLVPQGEFVVLGALTMAEFERGRTPGTLWLLITIAVLAIVAETVRAMRTGEWRHWRQVVAFAIASSALCALLVFLAPAQAMPLRIAATIALVAPMGPMLYWVAFRSIANASILTLLFAAVAVHYVLQGLMLPLFGPEGFRIPPLVEGRVDLGFTRLSLQLLLVASVFASAVVALWALFRYAVVGKILRATAINRIGAKLVGIRPHASAAAAFGLASLFGAVSGILVAPLTTVYYDSGFLLALKGFVGAVVGGFASFPLAAFGSLLVGVLESFSSFHASALKESLVFAALIPILLYMSLSRGLGHEDERE